MHHKNSRDTIKAASTHTCQSYSAGIPIRNEKSSFQEFKGSRYYPRYLLIIARSVPGSSEQRSQVAKAAHQSEAPSSTRVFCYSLIWESENKDKADRGGAPGRPDLEYLGLVFASFLLSSSSCAHESQMSMSSDSRPLSELHPLISRGGKYTVDKVTRFFQKEDELVKGDSYHSRVSLL